MTWSSAVGGSTFASSFTATWRNAVSAPPCPFEIS